MLGDHAKKVIAIVTPDDGDGLTSAVHHSKTTAQNGTVALDIVNSGNVGIGTTGPNYKLDVQGSSGPVANFGSFRSCCAGSNPTVGISEDTQSNGRLAWIQFHNSGYQEAYLRLAKDGRVFEMGDAQGVGADLALLNGAGARNVYISPRGTSYFSGGNVGIGTSAPSAKLEVSGTVKLNAAAFPDGSTQQTAWTGVLCGGDYAETVDVTGKKVQYEPGDVLVIDSENDSFAKSNEPYATSVAGIYSTKPGVVGRRSTDAAKAKDEIPMAMVGIVPTKVSAENGPIRRGDLLVTSSTPGYAMKGTDRSRITGAIVGKALGKLDAGSGVMDVLVSLQ
jgi:hypothetical protein